MKIKDKEKFVALAEIALSEDKRICKGVSLKNLVRLADGDLSPFGSALIDGCKVVKAVNGEAVSIYDGEASDYKIKAKTITVFGVEVESFTDEDLEQVNRHGLHVYAIAFNTESGGFGSIPDYCSISSLCNKTVFKSYAEGKAVADAMNRLGGFCEE